MKLLFQAQSFFQQFMEGFPPEKTPQRRRMAIGYPHPSSKPGLSDLLHLDLSQLPTPHFTMGAREVTRDGHLITYYSLDLLPAVCGIFSGVEVKVIGEKGRQVTFRSLERQFLQFFPIKQLVDDLYGLYGRDNADRRGFSDEDRERLLGGKYWSGRLWHQPSRKKLFALNLYADPEGLTLTIYLPAQEVPSRTPTQ